MFVLTIRSHKIRFIASLMAAVMAIAVTVMLFPRGDDLYVYPDEVLPAVKTVAAKDLKGISSNEDRVSLLKQYGWEVDPEPREIVEVTVPAQFDAVYESYNQLQTAEGLDLKKVAGKQVKRYTYVVLNAEYDGTVLCNLLIYKNRVVGGDICSARIDGFVHGLTRENDFLTGQST